ncbi:4HBT like protein [Polychaeton citri CBS 116435]|uniref:4HBT like protein n=1 Tax=Polychaeton citri CBS 116435 TaxID=1314669 RepID=A0A9P4Q146_9PEZI|nr:4HBT like protein [Polychaeton citri CBS 116435]
MAGTLSLGAALAGVTAVPALRHTLSRYIGGANVANNLFKILVFIFAFINLKNLPFIWHYRVFKGIIYQIQLNKAEQKPKHLFSPLITSSYNSLYDSDYNFHKSNSTYFADLDVARAHTVACIVKTGLKRLNRGDEIGMPNDTASAGGKYYVALGGVSCTFHRQIEPLQRYDIYTRVLSWDRKWLYLVSHIVKKGAIKPGSYALQPWKKSKRRAAKSQDEVAGNSGEEEDLKKYIFATSIAKYVAKKGRRTINPEIILERSNLLPPRPAGMGLPPRAESASPTPSETQSGASQDNGLTSPEAVAAQVSSRLISSEPHLNGSISADGWTWDDMEKERLRGLTMANHFDALAGLTEELKADDVLGQYGDWF